MKFKKEKIGETLFEGAIEIILTLILCAVGFGICYGFGAVFKVTPRELDLDSYALIGIVALVVIGVIIGKAMEFLRKHKKRRQISKDAQKEVNE